MRMLLLFIIFMCSRILMNKTRYKFGYTLRSYSNKCTLLPCITENRYSKSGIFFCLFILRLKYLELNKKSVDKYLEASEIPETY